MVVKLPTAVSDNHKLLEKSCETDINQKAWIWHHFVKEYKALELQVVTLF